MLVLVLVQQQLMLPDRQVSAVRLCQSAPTVTVTNACCCCCCCSCCALGIAAAVDRAGVCVGASASVATAAAAGPSGGVVVGAAAVAAVAAAGAVCDGAVGGAVAEVVRPVYCCCCRLQEAAAVHEPVTQGPVELGDAEVTAVPQVVHAQLKVAGGYQHAKPVDLQEHGLWW